MCRAAVRTRADLHTPLGERVDVHAFRRDELMRFTVTLAASEADTAYLTLDGDGLSVKGRAWLLGTESKV